ncbi:hypothetical protein [Burkholderia cepacia]|uniref:hypothetical protein n=2 Tax=Burkholderia cepacia TaxID=292 RepID=UPI001E354071|nr:hypothetical protein [Burkholderia cepacia]
MTFSPLESIAQSIVRLYTNVYICISRWKRVAGSSKHEAPSMTCPDPTPRQITVFVLYSVLCLPASMTVAGYAATRITQNVSNFEGGAGYAALWWIIILTCVFYGLSIALFALLRKRIAIVAAITVGFAVLSVPAFRFIYELAT